MQTRRLGTTDMDITTVGFGAWAIGGPDWVAGWGAQNDDDSVRAIRHAVDSGVNWVDTAAIYGLGHSEEVVARAVADIPEADRPLLFTKCGLLWDENDRHAEPVRNLAPESIHRECDASLARLGVERIDLYQFHWPDETGVPVEESWGAMQELIAAGKVRAGGVSNYDVSMLDAAQSVAPVASLQPPFSLIRREAAADLIPWCHENGAGVICYSPMQAGLLTGRFTAERAASLPDDDWRAGDDEFREPRLSRNLTVAEVLGSVGERHGVGAPAVAVAWVLESDGVTAAIVGARSPEQVDGWLPASDVSLTETDIAEIADVVEETGAGAGPVRPHNAPRA